MERPIDEVNIHSWEDWCKHMNVIPKDQYEARLRADMIAILTELQSEIDEMATELCDDGWWLTYNKLIQQKINSLREDEL